MVKYQGRSASRAGDRGTGSEGDGVREGEEGGGFDGGVGLKGVVGVVAGGEAVGEAGDAGPGGEGGVGFGWGGDDFAGEVWKGGAVSLEPILRLEGWEGGRVMYQSRGWLGRRRRTTPRIGASSRQGSKPRRGSVRGLHRGREWAGEPLRQRNWRPGR